MAETQATTGSDSWIDTAGGWMDDLGGFFEKSSDSFTKVAEGWLNFERVQAERDRIGAGQDDVNNTPEHTGTQAPIQGNTKRQGFGALNQNWLLLGVVGVAAVLLIRS